MRNFLRCAATVCVLTTASVVSATDRFELKGEDGTLHGQILLCNDCPSLEEEAKEPCDVGAEKGWYAGKPCGACLIEANYGELVRHPYDLRVIGKLVDADGQPVRQRFVKLFMPNGWTARSRTSDDGVFRLLLGATAERTSQESLIIDIGTQRDSTRGQDPHFALFLLPPEYKPCESNSGE